MRHLATILFSLSLLACGHEGSSGSDSPTSLVPSQSLNPKETENSLYIDTLAELGPCDSSNIRQLVYVKEDSQFHSCDKAGWIVVSIKGKDGKDGKDANPINQFWRDPITGRTWFFGGQATYDNSKEAAPTCQPGYSMATPEIAAEAFKNGIGTAMLALNLTQAFWIETQSGDTFGTIYKATGPVTVNSVTAALNLACYK